MKKFLTVLLMVVVLLTSSMAFAAQDINATNVIADTLILRPLGFAATVFGAAIFVIGLPFAAITKSVDQTAQVLIMDPYNYTFVRPVGDIGTTL